MISIQNITKTYQKGVVAALDNISIAVKRGELFGLIGPDGAGKTSLFRILATLILPDSGHAAIDGRDVVEHYRHIRNTIGYMPGKFALYQDLSIWENLQFYATVFGTTVDENYEQIKPIYSQIEKFKDRRAGQLSGGMKQKLALSCALVHKPELLLLDEPTTGVDPVSRQEFWDMLHLLKSQGLTILVSTPYMDEARQCDRIALIQKGKILDLDSPENIVVKHPMPLYSLSGPDMFYLLETARQWTGTDTCFAFGDSHHLKFNSEGTETALQAFLNKKGVKNTIIKPIQPNIEDVFMDLLNTQNITSL